MAKLLYLNTRRPTPHGAPVGPARSTALADGAKSADLHASLTPYLDPRDIYRALGEVHPDLYAAFRHEPTAWEELAEDWREFVRAVRRSPYSHALVAVFTVIVWTVGLLLPILLGAVK